MSSDFFKENRKAAAKAGRATFLGAPCSKNAHGEEGVSERYVLTGRCALCQRESVKNYTRKEAEKWRTMRGGG